MILYQGRWWGRSWCQAQRALSNLKFCQKPGRSPSTTALFPHQKQLGLRENWPVVPIWWAHGTERRLWQFTANVEILRGKSQVSKPHRTLETWQVCPLPYDFQPMSHPLFSKRSEATTITLSKSALLQTPYCLKHRWSPCAHLPSNQYHKVRYFPSGTRLCRLEEMLLVPVH